jgi:hypothetical protein
MAWRQHQSQAMSRGDDNAGLAAERPTRGLHYEAAPGTYRQFSRTWSTEAFSDYRGAETCARVEAKVGTIADNIWCAERHLPAIPAAPETVAAFLATEAARGIKPATIGRLVAAIRYAHKLAGYDDPPTSSEASAGRSRNCRSRRWSATRPSKCRRGWNRSE